MDNTNFEFYSQKSGKRRRATPDQVRAYMSPNWDSDALAGVPLTSGNTENLNEFRVDSNGDLWFIDFEGDGLNLNDILSGGASGLWVQGVGSPSYIYHDAGKVVVGSNALGWSSGDDLSVTNQISIYPGTSSVLNLWDPSLGYYQVIKDSSLTRVTSTTKMVYDVEFGNNTLVLSNNLVGINTSTPTWPLTIQNSGNGLRFTNNIGSRSLELWNDGANSYLNSQIGSLHFMSQGANTGRINTSGQFRLYNYGGLTFGGTPAAYSAWTTDGDFIERTVAQLVTDIETEIGGPILDGLWVTDGNGINSDANRVGILGSAGVYSALTFSFATGLGPNKVNLYPNSGYGFGYDFNNVNYLSENNHRFYTGSTNSTNGIEVLTIDGSSGAVGIGVNTPVYKHQVSGTVGTVAYGATSLNSGNDIALFASGTATGNLNIFTGFLNATGSAQGIIQNGGTGASKININVADGGGDAFVYFGVLGVTNFVMGLDNSGSDRFQMGYANTPSSTGMFTMLSDGRVGLNTNAPAVKFDVHSSDADIVYFRNSHEQLRFYADAGGAGMFTSNLTGFYINEANASFQFLDTGSGGKFTVATNGRISNNTYGQGTHDTTGVIASYGVWDLAGELRERLIADVVSDIETEIGGSILDGLWTSINSNRIHYTGMTPNSTRVGINQSDPVEYLHIADGNSDPLVYLEGRDGANVSGGLYSTGGALGTQAGFAVEWARGTKAKMNNNPTFGAYLTTTSLTNLSLGTGSERRMMVHYSGDIIFYKNDGITEGVYWDAANGYLGVNESSPTSDFHVNGTVTIEQIGGGSDVFSISSSRSNDPELAILSAPNAEGGAASFNIKIEDDLLTADKSLWTFIPSANGGFGSFCINPFGGRVVFGAADDIPEYNYQFVTGSSGFGIESTWGAKEIFFNPHGDSYFKNGSLIIGADFTIADFELYRATGNAWARIVNAESNLSSYAMLSIESTGASSGETLVRFYNAAAGQYWSVGMDNSPNNFLAISPNNGINGQVFRIGIDGAIDFVNYGVGSFTGTATYLLGVDALGNVIETSATGMGLWVTDANGINNDSQNVGIGTNSDASYELRVGGSNTRIQNAYFQLVGSDQYISNAWGGGFVIRPTVDDKFTTLSGRSSSTGGYTTSFRADFNLQYFRFSHQGHSNALFIESSGHVGFGTGDPASPVHIVGAPGVQNFMQQIESTNTVAYTQYYNSATGNSGSNDGLTVGINNLNAYFFNREAGSLFFGTNDQSVIQISSVGDITFYKDDAVTTGMYFDASSGNFSIGIAVPQRPLHVSMSNSDSSAQVISGQESSGASGYIISKGDYGAATDNRWSIGSPASENRMDWVYGIGVLGDLGQTPKMTLTTDGELGIGVADPQEYLHLFGGIRLGNLGTSSFRIMPVNASIHSSFNSSGDNISFYHEATSQTDTEYMVNFVGPQVTNDTLNKNVVHLHIKKDFRTTVNNATYRSIFINSAIDSLGTGAIYGMEINQALTNLGGTYYALALTGGGTYGVFQTNSTVKNYFAGQVGIGTIPSADLDVRRSLANDVVVINLENQDNTNVNSNAALLIKTGGSSAGDPYLNFRVTSQTDWAMGIDNSDLDKFKISESFLLGSSTHLTIVPGGFFGFKTTTPAVDFDFNGTMIIRSFLYDSGSSTGAEGDYLVRGASGIVWEARNEWKEETLTAATSNMTGDAQFIDCDDDAAGGAMTVNLPAISSVAKRPYHFVKTGSSGNVTLDGNGSESIGGSSTYVISSQYDKVTLYPRGSRWYII